MRQRARRFCLCLCICVCLCVSMCCVVSDGYRARAEAIAIMLQNVAIKQTVTMANCPGRKPSCRSQRRLRTLTKYIWKNREKNEEESRGGAEKERERELPAARNFRSVVVLINTWVHFVCRNKNSYCSTKVLSINTSVLVSLYVCVCISLYVCLCVCVKRVQLIFLHAPLWLKKKL